MPDISKSPVNERKTAFHENLFRPFLTSIPQKLSVWIINSVKMPDMRGLKICRKWTNFIRIRFKRFTVGKFPKRNHRVIRIIFHKNRNLLTVNLTFFGSETGGIGQNDTKQHFQKFPKAKRGYDTCCKMWTSKKLLLPIKLRRLALHHLVRSELTVGTRSKRRSPNLQFCLAHFGSWYNFRLVP